MRFTRHTRIWCSALALIIALSLPGCSLNGASEIKKEQIFAMDTLMLLTAYGRRAQEGLDAAKSLIIDLDARLDPESEGSEVYALNHAGGKAVTVSEPLRRMLEVSSAVWRRSGGALDVTIYPVVKAWGFIDGAYRVPSETELKALLKRVDMGAVTINGDTVQFPEGMELSFGAVAKGYASQMAVEAMREAGVRAGILSLGGNVQTLGKKPDGSPWTVAVQDPFDLSAYAGILHVGETAVVTSGGYQRYFEKDGVYYHHILDPSTGVTARSGLASVTVVCADGTTADALSTTLFVLGEEKALAYRSQYGGFDLVLITEDRRVIVAGGLEFTEQGDYEYSYVD